jgi:hypothetical protein
MLLLPEIRKKIVNMIDRIHLTEVSFVEADTEDNGLTR